jgi:hypothetical protein
MSKGDAVTINYGADKSNAFLLEAYGFSTPANLADRLPWPWIQPSETDFADLQADSRKLDTISLEVLESLGVHMDSESAGVHCSMHVSL